MSDADAILYVGARLPKRSETFVYREVLGLRERGVSVPIASVHPPEPDLEEPELRGLADESIPIYGRGLRGKLLVATDACRQSLVRLPRGLFETSPLYWVKYQLQCDAGYALAKRVRSLGVAHVHAHMAHVPTTVAMHCAEALGVPFSFTGHAADLFRDRSALKTKLKRAVFVACISHWHRAFYNELVPRRDEDYPVIRCGVDVDQFKPTQNGDREGMLAVGRLVRKKGFDLLIQAYADAGCETRLTIVGDGPERAPLQRQIDDAGLGDRIELVGAKANQEVRSMMQQRKTFVLPCRVAEDGDRDGIPVVLMEAMASGMAVISGDLPTIRELVEDGVTGLMTQPSDMSALAEAIRRLHDDEGFSERLSIAGRRRVIDEFALSVNLDRLTSAFLRARHADPGLNSTFATRAGEGA
ncbi:MAG: glycosyltransferase family 4 protein [Phycisphaeraceae bacterium]